MIRGLILTGVWGLPQKPVNTDLSQGLRGTEGLA